MAVAHLHKGGVSISIIIQIMLQLSALFHKSNSFHYKLSSRSSTPDTFLSSGGLGDGDSCPVSCLCCQMRFLLLFSRQGKLRLQKWFLPTLERDKKKIIREMTTMVLARPPRTCNFMHWKDLKIIYKRWSALSPIVTPVTCHLSTPVTHHTHPLSTFSSDMQAYISVWR